MTPEEEVIILRRKLAETEARVTSRFIVSAQQTIPSDLLPAFLKQFNDNESLDLLEIERNIADNAQLLSDVLQDLYQSVQSYKAFKRDFDEVEQKFLNLDPEVNPQQIFEKMVRVRETMFSLAEEYKIKYQVSQNHLS